MSRKKKKLRVLAIDSGPADGAFLELLFKHAGYVARRELIGAWGLECFERWHPDIVLLEIWLPDVDPLDLLRKFKTIDRRSQVIILSSSGASRASDAMEAGAFAFIEKPFDAELLLAAVDKAIKERASAC